MKNTKQTSTVFRFSLKTLLCLVLLAACYLGGRESQRPLIQEQSERIEKLEADVISDEERVARAQQLSSLMSQIRQANEMIQELKHQAPVDEN